MLDVAAERVGLEHVAQHGVADRLGVEEEPVGGSTRLGRVRTDVLPAQDAQVRAQLALLVQDRRVAALSRLERLDVVRDLALQEVGCLRAADEELRTA